MNRLFNPENKFWNFFAKLADVACMSILWIICCIPIITVGAATASFYGFTMHQVSETEGGIWKSFWSGVKTNFKKGTILWGIEVAVLLFLTYDLFAAWQYFTLSTSTISLLVLSFCTCISLILLSMLQYIYPLLAVFHFPIKKILSNSFIIAMGNLPVTITLFVLFGLVLVGCYYLSGLFFFWIGLYIFFSSYFITGVFKKYTGEIPMEPNRFMRWRGNRND